jgi:transcriptional regulator
MYTPTHFQETDPAALAELIAAHNFGTLISTVDGRPFATHLPFVHDRAGARLLGHMSRANPHWRELERGPGQALVVFQGPHAYVSPSWYEEPGVPTWNYTAVHVYGRFRIVADEAEHEAALRALSEQHESGRPAPWRADFSSDMVRRLIRATVAFDIAIEEYEGKFKLSQNRPEGDRARVIGALQAESGDGPAGIAELMAERQ